jgi:hypothetical protein
MENKIRAFLLIPLLVATAIFAKTFQDWMLSFIAALLIEIAVSSHGRGQ